MQIYVKMSLISIFSLFWFSITILSYTLILPVLQLQTQQLTTSQIRAHIEYLIQLITFFCAHFTLKIQPHRRFLVRFNDDSCQSDYFFRPHCVRRTASDANSDIQKKTKLRPNVETFKHHSMFVKKTAFVISHLQNAAYKK